MDKEEPLDIEAILKEIAEAWKETKEHFGEEFPFEDELDFKIVEKGKIFPGKIEYKKEEDDD